MRFDHHSSERHKWSDRKVGPTQNELGHVSVTKSASIPTPQQAAASQSVIAPSDWIVPHNEYSREKSWPKMPQKCPSERVELSHTLGLSLGVSGF